MAFAVRSERNEAGLLTLAGPTSNACAGSDARQARSRLSREHFGFDGESRMHIVILPTDPPFGYTHGLLRQFCGHVVVPDVVAADCAMPERREAVRDSNARKPDAEWRAAATVDSPRQEATLSLGRMPPRSDRPAARTTAARECLGPRS